MSSEPERIAAPHLHCRLLASGAEFEALIPAWEALAAAALESSPSAEPWMFLPAFRHKIGDVTPKLLAIFAGDQAGAGADGTAALCGVFPLEVVERYRGLPIKVLRLWNHVYSVSTAPLLHSEHAAACLREFFRWVRAEWPGTTLIEFPELRGESRFFHLLTDVLREDDRISQVVDVHTRACFRPRGTAQTYIDTIGTAHHRKEMRRQERRLGELGKLAFEQLDADADVVPWVEAFIALEMQGWKGKDQTAFGNKDNHRAFLLDVVKGAAARGRLMCLGLRLDTKVIALKLNFLSPDGGYTFKIAFDETFSKFSPGTLLELENIRRAHANPNIRWLDSLALPDHAMMKRLWLDRTAIVTTLVAPGRLAGELVVGAFPALRVLKRLVRKGR